MIGIYRRLTLALLTLLFSSRTIAEPMRLQDYLVLAGPPPDARIAYGPAQSQFVELFRRPGQTRIPGRQSIRLSTDITCASFHRSHDFVGSHHAVREKRIVDHRRLISVAPNGMTRSGSGIANNMYLEALFEQITQM